MSVVERAHQAASNNEAQVLASERCGCFYCLKIYSPAEIVEWVEEIGGGKTALCPYCGIDAVIGSASQHPITADFMRQMKGFWFD